MQSLKEKYGFMLKTHLDWVCSKERMILYNRKRNCYFMLGDEGINLNWWELLNINKKNKLFNLFNWFTNYKKLLICSN